MRHAVLVALLCAAPALVAQTTPLTVRGLAFDSLRNTPLADAFVSISGGGKTSSTTSDSTGIFRFDGVLPGSYTFSMQHAALDSLGFPGVSIKATVSESSAPVRISIPSFATLWRTACGASAPPADSGFVYGVVRDASTQNVLANASVDLSWVDMAMDAEKRVTQRRWRNQTRTDERGSYGVCGVPAGLAVRVQATTESAASGAIDLAPSDARVQRRDLFVAPTASTRSVLRGVIAGTVIGAAGSPFRDARVLLEGVAEVRTTADGRFTIRDVPAGTRQLEITAIGTTPVSAIVDVMPNDTALVTAELKRVATLDPVKVTALARRRDFIRGVEERKRSGFGYISDSTTIGAMGTTATVFDGFPSTEVRRGRGSGFTVTFPAGMGRCAAIVWIDRRRADFEQLSMLHPLDIALVEVYPHRFSVPMGFMVPGQLCGAVVVWTKFSVM